MSFGELLFHPQVWPFSLMLGFFFAAALLEIFMVFTGAGSNLGLDLSVDFELPDVTNHGAFLDWLGLGRVPFLITFASFCLCLGVIGMFAQALQLETIGTALPWPLVMVGAAALSLPPVRLLNYSLGRIWPKDVETSAVSTDSFVGHEAEVVLGQIGTDEPGQIKFRDTEGTIHHGMAYADRPGETYTQGDAVLIVGRRSSFYTVILHPNPSLPASRPGAT